MSATIIHYGLTLGFFLFWLGGMCAILAMVWPNLSLKRIQENNTLPVGERIQRHNDDLNLGAESRLGRIGQVFLASGVSFFIVIGLYWLILKVLTG